MIDFERGEEYPSARIAERLLAWTAPARRELGLDPKLPERNSAQRQLDLLAAGASMEEVYAQTVRETRTSYADGGPA
jgi:carboxylate-amine ligase